MREPVERHPAHRRRVRVDALSAAVLPEPRVRLADEAQRLRAERLEALEQRRVAHARQALVDEHLRRAEDDAAVGIVLELLGRLVADAHRPHAAEALEVRRDPLVERQIVDDAVDGFSGRSASIAIVVM